MLIVNETYQYLTSSVHRSVYHIACFPLSESMNTEIRHTNLNGRLPSDLYTLYGRYKKDTKAIVQWLIPYGTSKDKHSQALSVRDINRLAGVVSKKVSQRPEAIKYQFEAAITARRKLTKYFKERGHDNALVTSTHEFFTQRQVVPNCVKEYLLIFSFLA